MTWRIRSVRKRILLLALVPLLSLFGLYVVTTSITARNAINLARADTLKNATGQPTGTFEGEIQAERLLAVLYLAAPTPENQAKLAAVEQQVGREATALRGTLMSGATMNNASAPQARAIDTLLAAMKGLPALQDQVAARTISRPAAIAAFNTLVDDGDQVLNQTIRQETDSAIVAQALAFVRIGRVGDLLGQEDAILLGDLSTGSFPAADRRQFTQLVGAHRYLVQVTLPDLDPAYRAFYTRDVSSLADASLTQLENRVMAAGPAAPARDLARSPGRRRSARSPPGSRRRARSRPTRSPSRPATSPRSTNLQLIVTGGIGLLLVIFSIVVAILTARSLVRELGSLRQSALALANERLPEVVDRLALGQDVDVSAEAPDIPASSDEIGQVRDAFAAVQQTAVRAAVGQARLRQGMSEVFRNLARRSQSLLHRQLALLDAMERRARDPQELEDLFRLDHLTTRMRRHAESLIILSGHQPARGWRNPVPLVDVLRAAVAEVEDYTRIRASPDPGVVLHLGHRGTQHVHQRHRVAPAARGLMTGQNDQALGVPPHAGGQVVQAEQVLQFLRVPCSSLHGVQQCELAVQQRLAAPGQVAEDLAHALPQPRLPDGGPHRGLLHRGEGVPHLADLVGGRRDVRGFGGDVDVLAQGEPVHHLGQPLVRQGECGLAQPAQFPHQAAGGEDGDHDGDDHEEQADAAGHDQLQVRARRDVAGLLGERVGRLPARIREPGGDRADRLPPGQRGHRGQVPRGCGHHLVLQPGQRGGKAGELTSRV